MKTLRITLEGKTYDVAVEVLGETVSVSTPAPVPAVAPVAPIAAPAPAPVVAAVPAPAPIAAGAGSVLSPMAGQVMKIKVAVGQTVAQNEEVIVLEAMKMETPVPTSIAGTIQSILVKEGEAVSEGQILLTIG